MNLVGRDLMNTLPVTFNVPERMTKYVDLTDRNFQFRVQELMMFELIHNNRLSFGKAAEKAA
jgi:hypothetical protein